VIFEIVAGELAFDSIEARDAWLASPIDLYQLAAAAAAGAWDWGALFHEEMADGVELPAGAAAEVLATVGDGADPEGGRDAAPPAWEGATLRLLVRPDRFGPDPSFPDLVLTGLVASAAQAGARPRLLLLRGTSRHDPQVDEPYLDSFWCDGRGQRPLDVRTTGHIEVALLDHDHDTAFALASGALVPELESLAEARDLVLDHTGGDDHGIWSDDNVLLAHIRDVEVAGAGLVLGIAIDPSAADRADQLIAQMIETLRADQPALAGVILTPAVQIRR